MNKTFSVALIAVSANAAEWFGGGHDPLANDWGSTHDDFHSGFHDDFYNDDPFASSFHDDDPLASSVNKSVFNTFDDVLEDIESHDDDFGFHSLAEAQNAVQKDFATNLADASKSSSALIKQTDNSLVNDFNTLSLENKDDVKASKGLSLFAGHKDDDEHCDLKHDDHDSGLANLDHIDLHNFGIDHEHEKDHDHGYGHDHDHDHGYGHDHDHDHDKNAVSLTHDDLHKLDIHHDHEIKLDQGYDHDHDHGYDNDHKQVDLGYDDHHGEGYAHDIFSSISSSVKNDPYGHDDHHGKDEGCSSCGGCDGLSCRREKSGGSSHHEADRFSASKASYESAKRQDQGHHLSGGYGSSSASKDRSHDVHSFNQSGYGGSSATKDIHDRHSVNQSGYGVN